MSEATESAAVVDGGGPARQFAGHLPVAGPSGTVEAFIAHVLHRAHHAARASGAPDDARAVLGLAELFAEELADISEDFDRLRFIQAAIDEPE